LIFGHAFHYGELQASELCDHPSVPHLEAMEWITDICKNFTEDS